MTKCTVHFVRLLILFVILPQVYNSQSSFNQVSTFTDCGGTLRDARGVITSPNFPNAYPVPIYCKWVIEAPEDKVIAVYFTQYYMRDGVRAAEYALYTEGLKMEKEDYGILSSDKEPTYLITNKHILVLEFSVRETGNIHLRIRQFFLDVFGFNITYEMIDKTQNVRKDECLYHHCSFTGKCFASSDFESYYCSCFSDFFGKECQYNESCGPTAVNNLCMNGGTCRFYIGSTARICDCPPGYKGVRCEIKTEMDLDECANYGCSQSCSVKDKIVTCTCPGGYYLLDDGKTCTQEGKTRYFVSIKMYEQNVDLAHLDSVRYKQLKKGVENALNALLKPRLYQVDNLTVTSFEPSPMVHFHFLGEKDDNQQAKVVLEEALKTGKIDKYRVNRTYLVLKWEPALSIQGIETSEKMPIVEGTEFSLACIAQGSASMTFKWFKDGAPINIYTPYRSIWTSQVPKNSKDQYTALLGFDRTNVLDSGIFTCQVSDWDSTHNKSLHINVVSAPLPLLEPLTATVYQGESFIITCVPKTYDKFGYTWLKNGKVLNPSLKTELIEDLYPVGTRLLVHSAKSSVVYTCIISSNTGSTKKNSIITVIDKETTPVCQAEKHKNIEWSITAANTINLQSCPRGYAGIISRKCNIRKGNIANWEEPDYSSCLSARLKGIKAQFDSLKMGYLLTDLETIIQELKAYILDNNSNLHHAEGEPIAELLEEMLDYYGKTNDQFNNSWNISETFIDIISFLLETPYLIQKQSHIFKLYNNLIGFGEIKGSLLEIDDLATFHKELFALEVKHIQYGKMYHLRFPHWQNPSRNDFPSKVQQSWITNSIEIEVNREDINAIDNYNMTVTSIFFKNLSEYLPEHYFTRLGGLDIEYQLHSQPVAVSIKSVGVNKPTEKQDILIKIKMAHLKNKNQMLKNITCGIADFSDSKFEFLMEGCQVINIIGNFTTCQCSHTGMYAVLLTSFTNAKKPNNPNEFEIIAGIGCSIGAFLLCLTFFMLLILWKKLRGAITALKLQVCVALVGAYIAILKGLQESLQKEYYSYVLSIIQFFLLAAFSMQLCLGLIVYIEFTNLQSIKYPELKVAAMGWAVPTIVVGATLASQVPEGFLIESWWLRFGTNFFLSYTIAVFIIFMLQLILFLTVKAEIRHHLKEESSKQKIIANRTKLLCRSLVIAVALLLTSVFSILYINYEEEIFKYLFSFSSAALGIIIFLCYTVCSENAFLLCCPKTSNDNDDEKEEPKLNTESNSFRSFLKPEIVGETACYLNKFSDHMEKRKSLDQIHKLKPQVEICREPDWLETGCLLQEKKPNLKSATIHGAVKNKYKNGKGKNFDDMSEAEDIHQISPQKFRWRHLDPSKATAFELEPMYDSPRSNLHGKTLESVIEEDSSISNPNRTSLPPPYLDSNVDTKKDYSIKSNPLSLFDSQNQENLRTDYSALMVPKNTESTNSSSSKSNNKKLTDPKGTFSNNHMLHEATQSVPPIKLDVTNILESTPDDNSHPTNSVADLISRDDDFATEMDMPLVVTDNIVRNDQVSPSRKSWSMTAV